MSENRAGFRMNLFRRIFFVLLAGLPPQVAVAANLSDAELKSLPPYCEARMRRTAQYDYWSKTLGPDFIHTHHYCSGLGLLNRYYAARTPQQKRYNLEGANGALTYMVQHASPTFSLMPEVYLYRGQVLALMNKQGEALTDLQKAREMNPRLTKAYTQTADIYDRMKRKPEALAVVTEGLRHVPDSKVLQRIYREHGGMLPYPAPVAATPAPSANPQEGGPESPAATQEPAVAESAAPAAVTPGASGTPAAATDPAAAAAPAPATPKIGSPTNPWCRFCPEPAQ
jgi:tetratricopeptide (TPR) repeat protein